MGVRQCGIYAILQDEVRRPHCPTPTIPDYFSELHKPVAGTAGTRLNAFGLAAGGFQPPACGGNAEYATALLFYNDHSRSQAGCATLGHHARLRRLSRRALDRALSPPVARFSRIASHVARFSRIASHVARFSRIACALGTRFWRIALRCQTVALPP